MRLPGLPLVGAAVFAALGVAGLVRGAVAQSPAAAPDRSAAASIVVTKAYVAAPVPPSRTAAAYFTVSNTSGADDRLLRVGTSAGSSAVLQVPTRHGSMRVAPHGVVVPAHGRLVLAAGEGHVLIEHLYRSVRPGQSVHLELDFRNAGPIDVAARVIGVGARMPGEH